MGATSPAVRRSLAISAIEKPAAKLRGTTNWRPFTSVALLLPVEVLNTSTIVPGSRPKDSPTISASHIATTPAAER